MNYNYLRYFSVLAQVEHYTLAAARLGISQPSLSSAIHNLETDLGGITLFEKVGRNVRLTEEGRFYQKKVDAALKELHDASMILRSSRDSAPVVIRLGMVSGSLNGTLARQIAAYSAQHSRVRFRITESSSQELMDMVRQEKLDMAITDVSDRDRSLHFRKLFQRSLFAAVPASHPLARQATVEPQDFLGLPQIVFNYDVGDSFRQWASGAPNDSQILCTVNTAQAAVALVREGLGVAFLPEECLVEDPRVRYLPIRNWNQALYMCILYDKWLEPLIWEFVEQTMKAMRKNT